MSEIQVECPACGNCKPAKAQLNGRKVRCKCGHVFKIEAAAANVAVVERYHLKVGLLRQNYMAHYACPNEGCPASLKSNSEEIGMVDRCPTCGIPFRLHPRRFLQQIESDRVRENKKTEKQLMADKAKKERREKKERQRDEAKAEHLRLEEISRQRELELKKEREQERLRAEAKAKSLANEQNEGESAPPRRRLRKALIACVLIIVATGGYAVIVGTKGSLNPLQSIANSKLQGKFDRIIETDYRNSGVEASVYFKDSVGTSTIVFDLQDVRSSSKLDVFRVLLEFAEATKDESFSTLELAFKGDTKFKLDGYDAKKLGRERSYQNPSYTTRVFPALLKTKYGTQAYSEWTGGILGVLSRQMEDFNDFHDKWYAHRL